MYTQRLCTAQSRSSLKVNQAKPPIFNLSSIWNVRALFVCVYVSVFCCCYVVLIDSAQCAHILSVSYVYTFRAVRLVRSHVCLTVVKHPSVACVSHTNTACCGQCVACVLYVVFFFRSRSQLINCRMTCARRACETCTSAKQSAV